MAVFFTADLHIGHGRIIELCNRPFANVNEMDEALIERWNQRVGAKSDDVYVIGDFGNWRDPVRLQKVFNKLNGRKHLIIGNHDDRSILNLPWSTHPRHRDLIKIDGEKWFLDHFPVRSWDHMYKESWHVHGHCHGDIDGVGKSTDVGVDAWDYYPCTPEEVMERIKTMNADWETYAPERSAGRGTPRSFRRDESQQEPEDEFYRAGMAP